MSQILDTFAAVTLDGSGNGTASAGPNVAEQWSGVSVYVSVATNAAEASGTLYLGSGLAPGEALAQTATASSGDTYVGNEVVQLGQKYRFRWTGGDPGALATMSLYGTRTPV